MLRRFVIVLIAISIMGCPGGGDKAKGRFKPVLKDAEEVLSDLKSAEDTLNKLLLNQSVEGAEGKTCAGLIELDALNLKLDAVRKKIDELKPDDMPMTSEILQTGLDPNTGQPILETTYVIDWGKVTGDEQRIWANMHNLHSALFTSLKAAEVACQCIESNDKKSLFCNIIAMQMPEGKLSLEIESIEKVQIVPIHELLEKSKP